MSQSVNLSKFSKGCSELKRHVDTCAERFTKTVVSTVFDTVLNNSPVKTGNFVSNWRASSGEGDSSYKPAKHGKSRDESRDAAIQAAKTRASTIINDLKPYVDVWVTNSTPYGTSLEFGTPGSMSNQAPNGVARVSVIEAADTIAGLKNVI